MQYFKNMSPTQIEEFMHSMMQTEEFQLLSSSIKMQCVSTKRQLQNGTFSFCVFTPYKNYDMSYLNLHVSGYFRLCHTKQHNYFQEPDGWVQHIRSPIDLLQFSEDVSLHDRYIKLFQRLIKYAKKRNLL